MTHFSHLVTFLIICDYRYVYVKSHSIQGSKDTQGRELLLKWLRSMRFVILTERGGGSK